MAAQPTADLLQLITGAVTPVVMVSVGAVLILGINSKYQSMADRIRNLTAEFRNPSTSEPRRQSIAKQMVLFRRRARYASNAQRLLYLSVALYLCTAMLIIVSSRVASWSLAAFGLFLTGVILMVYAVILEFQELRLAGQTLDLELQDAVSTAPAKELVGRD